jgi:LacI family transcriptional regulator, kdg operon repressor
MKKVTIADVAEQAGVSKSTVSQYLNRRYEYMSDETRRKIGQAISELDYRPNMAARSLKKKSTKTIGVIVANIVHSFTTQILNELEKNLHENGFHMIVCNANDRLEKEREHIEVLLAKQVDGIIAFPAGGNADLFSRLYAQSFPVVFIDRKMDELPIPAILLDNKKASSIGVETFLESGRKNLAFITGPIDQPNTPREERLEGFGKSLEKAGLDYSSERLKAVSFNQVPAVLDAWMADMKPDGIMAGNDRILLEILNYARRHELSIPEDLGVISIDEVAFASFFTPSLTTIEQPVDEMAKKATEILLKQIQTKQYDDQDVYRVEPILNRRASH